MFCTVPVRVPSERRRCALLSTLRERYTPRVVCRALTFSQFLFGVIGNAEVGQDQGQLMAGSQGGRVVCAWIAGSSLSEVFDQVR